MLVFFTKREISSMNSRQFLDLAEAIKSKQFERCLEIITQNPEVLDQVSRTNEICADAISRANSNLEVKRGQITGTGLTPLHLAVISGNIPIIQLLLVKRPDLVDKIPIEEGNNIQLTPLELAFYFEDEVLISLLFENGADIKLVQNHFKSIGEEEKFEQSLLSFKNTQLAEKIRQKLKPASNVDDEQIQPKEVRQMLIDAYTQALWDNLISKTNGVVGNIRPNVVRSLYEELAAKIKYDFKQDREKEKLFAETVIDEEVIRNILINITNNLKNDKIDLKILGHTRTWFTSTGKEPFKLLLNAAKAWPDVFEEIKPTPVDNKTVTENQSQPKQDAVTTRESQTQLENNDEDLLGFGNTQEAHNIGVDTPPIPTGTPVIESRFKRESRLQPDDVYYAACGIFNEHQFTCIDAITGDGYPKELAKIYRRSDDGMLYIMYYPGKDNHHPTTLENLAQPLDHIMQKANDAIAKKYGTLALNNAKKIFVLAESNTYFGVSIRHYIKGDLTDGTLTTVDSINRSYDESYVTQSKHLTHTKRKTVKTGYQNMILDNWTCGYHSLEAIERDIMGQAAPKEFKVTDDVITKHDRYYKSGFNTVVVSTSSLQENTETSILMKGAEEESAQQRDTSPDAAYNADEINACIESYELSRYPEFLIQPDSIKEKNGGYDAFSLVTQNEDSIFGDDNFFLRILLHYIRNQISKGKNINQLRIAIPLHFGSEGSGHYVPFGIQLDDINSEIANKIHSHLMDNQEKIDQILANDPFKNLLRQIYGSVTAHFFDSTVLSYLDESRDSDRKWKFIAALNKSFTSVKMIQSTPIQQTDGTYKQGTDEENAGNGCGPLQLNTAYRSYTLANQLPCQKMIFIPGHNISLKLGKDKLNSFRNIDDALK